MSIQQNFPAITPSLSLNFARSKTLDPRITFSRTSTATRVNGQGLIEVVSADTPRFDHEYDPVSGTVRSLGLLVEEQRENLVTYSEQFNQSAWYKGRISVSTNAITAPDGTLTAEKLRATTDTNISHLMDSPLISTDAGDHTFSAYFKAGEYDYVIVDLRDSVSLKASAVLDLRDGTTSDETGTISVVPFPDGWYRLVLSATLAATTSWRTVRIFVSDDGTTGGYTGDNTSGIYIWGAQLEEGAFPTSYIPTSGSTATRNPDSVTMTGDNFSDWYNQSEGSILWRGTIHSIPISGSRIFEIYNSSADTERVAISVENNGEIYMRVRRTNETTQIYGLGTVSLGSEYKISLGVDGSSLCLAVNDEIKTIISDSFTLSSSDTLIFTDLRDIGGSRKFTTRHIGLSYYPRRLSNSNLQNLTK